MPQSLSWTRTGAVLAGLAVVCGAFAAHGLNTHFADIYAGQTRVVAGVTVPLAEKYLEDFKTGAEYQMYHSLALLAVGLVSTMRPSRSLNWAGWSFLGGIVLFSGSLYALTLLNIPKLGMITPIGGVLFLAGWGFLAHATCPKCAPTTDPAI
ncbi:MAG: DUF423 domain-containing protein [Planctomycetaceae bacterium]|nr:DUF423 domain-containing protein [Planctomycetaceae bacterium]